MEITFKYLLFFQSQFCQQTLQDNKVKSSEHSLGSVDGFGIKVTLCVH